MSAADAGTRRALAELTAGIAAAPADLTVSDVTLDSRAVTPGGAVPRLPRPHAPRH